MRVRGEFLVGNKGAYKKTKLRFIWVVLAFLVYLLLVFRLAYSGGFYIVNEGQVGV